MVVRITDEGKIVFDDTCLLAEPESVVFWQWDIKSEKTDEVDDEQC